MTSRVGPKGQVVIPKPMRDALGLRPGDQVDFALEPGGVRVEPARTTTSLKGRLAGLDLVGELLEDRRRELER